MYSPVEKYRVGDAVYDGRKPERYGKIIALRVEKCVDGRGEPWDRVVATWRRPYRGGWKDEEVTAWHLSRFEDLIDQQVKLVEKWLELREKAEGIEG